ncbi:uncharacterized protein LOC141601705 [Silene latifolia]|uniref:uncharacterized protein LOC141601705 n=1 Tax=Silene latifolia TaxID=37657 RepID=UPI003D77367A
MLGLWQASPKGYTVAAGYDWLRVVAPKVPWRHLCWNVMNVPRTSFIFWACQHRKLLTLDRLQKRGIVQATTCFICGIAPENHEHLFSLCEYSRRCMELMQQKIHIRFVDANMVTWFSKARTKSRLQRVVAGACYVGLLAGIWQVRNHARLYHQVNAPRVLVNQVWRNIKERLMQRNRRMLSTIDQQWIDSIV